jgi:hypothetical protein
LDCKKHKKEKLQDAQKGATRNKYIPNRKEVLNEGATGNFGVFEGLCRIEDCNQQMLTE